MTDFRTPLSKARGLGAAGHGTDHVIMQRALSVCLLFGFFYCALSILLTTNLGQEQMRAWLGNVLNASVMAMVLISALWHFVLGIQVIIEDYIHKSTTKLTLMLSVKIFAALVSLISIFSILKVFLGQI
jgi:succinate dehydrogenase / fumarate reductase, membrane anchor subunit